MAENDPVITQWRRAAPYWEKHRETIRRMFAPVTEALVAESKVAPGQAVLDVATGPGEPALSIVDVVGSAGSVVGVDLIPEMVEAARREAAIRGIHNARFETATAENLPFETNSFDAVVSRFGVMFFPTPVNGIREMLRVARPQSRLALAVWHFAERNPFQQVIARVVDKYVGTIGTASDAPDPFRFAEPGKLLAVLNEAGAIDSSERVLKFAIDSSLSPDEFWTLRSEMSDRLRSMLGTLTRTQVEEIKREVLIGLREYSRNGELSFPAEVLIVSGGKSS
jgi:SAM-dependent methyltransferase